MNITVKLFASLGQYSPEGESAKPFTFDIEQGDSLKSLVRTLNIPEEDIRIKFVNGRTQDWDYRLQHDDEVGFFPPIGGG